MNISVSFHDNVALVLAASFVLLSLVTLTWEYVFYQRYDPFVQRISERIRSWWYMLILFGGAILLPTIQAVWILALFSFSSLKEFMTLAPTRNIERKLVFYLYLCIPIQYYLAGAGHYRWFSVFVPLYLCLFIPVRQVFFDKTRAYLASAGIFNWAAMDSVYSLSHLAFLLALPDSLNPIAGSAGWVLYYILVNQFKDVAQVIGQVTIGKTPVVQSRGKERTWEGLALGVVGSILLAVLLAPLLTPFSWWQAAGIGFVVGTFGFFGDLCASNFRLDLGFRDKSNMFPGQGGFLDQTDQMMVTAPLYFHMVYHLVC